MGSGPKNLKILVYCLILLYVLYFDFSYAQTPLNKSRENDILGKSFHQKRREALRKLLPPSTVAVFFFKSPT